MKTIFKLMVVSLVIGLFLGCTSMQSVGPAPKVEVYSPSPKSEKELWETGKELLKNGYPRAALTDFVKALDANPDYGENEAFMSDFEDAVTKSKVCDDCLRR